MGKPGGAVCRAQRGLLFPARDSEERMPQVTLRVSHRIALGFLSDTNAAGMGRARGGSQLSGIPWKRREAKQPGVVVRASGIYGRGEVRQAGVVTRASGIFGGSIYGRGER